MQFGNMHTLKLRSRKEQSRNRCFWLCTRRLVLLALAMIVVKDVVFPTTTSHVGGDGDMEDTTLAMSRRSDVVVEPDSDATTANTDAGPPMTNRSDLVEEVIATNVNEVEAADDAAAAAAAADAADAAEAEAQIQADADADANATTANEANDTDVVVADATTADNDNGTNSTDLKKHRASLHLVGERHSGTTWINRHLTDCFEPDVSVRSGLSRWKHWFQEDGDFSSFQSQGGEEFRKTVVVAQFRHPYHWVEAMRVKPVHAPEHSNLTWHEFVTSPWTKPTDSQDEGDVNVTLSSGTEQICQYHYSPNEVVPCLEMEAAGNKMDWKGRDDRSVYEMRHDGSGMPYDSILELRADKIQNFLSIADFEGIQDLFPVHYETMVRNGTATLIHTLEEALGVEAHCSPMDPQSSLFSRPLAPEYVEWMKEHVDWVTEDLIGYNDVDWETEAFTGYDDSTS
jgi:hypothetical protein